MPKITTDYILGDMLMHSHDAGDVVGVVQSVVAGSNITVDSTDPANPIVASTADTTDMVTISTNQNILSVKTFNRDLRIQQGKKIIFEQ